jgi:hypothetical protein
MKINRVMRLPCLSDFYLNQFFTPFPVRYPTRSATSYLCWQAVGRWSYFVRLQHSEGVYASSRTPSPRWAIIVFTNCDELHYFRTLA